jgi:hypothetical protein
MKMRTTKMRSSIVVRAIYLLIAAVLTPSQEFLIGTRINADVSLPDRSMLTRYVALELVRAAEALRARVTEGALDARVLRSNVRCFSDLSNFFGRAVRRDDALHLNIG